uniref:NADP dependent oxidoreductase domain containing 1 n=1 Tax=Myripristis murdjan TaxID=586833 RepID=A0A667YG68_9TELE
MQDLTAGLSTFSFDCGLTEDQEELLSLRARSAALSICGCAHAVFWCQLAHSLRGLINRHTTQRVALASERDSDLRVGILGLGHTGKQLLLCLLEKTDTKPSHIKISTRRPETFAQSGVECYFDNGRLAAWADVLFLCCLPSHLPKVCASLHSHLPPRCLIYSFLSAVPVTRYHRLHAPHTQTQTQACVSMRSVTPFSNPMFQIENIPIRACDIKIIIKPSLFFTSSRPFPWITLTDAQTKETPLSRFLSRSKSVQEAISAAYKALLEKKEMRDWGMDK